jgi:hypothetical protein
MLPKTKAKNCWVGSGEAAGVNVARDECLTEMCSCKDVDCDGCVDLVEGWDSGCLIVPNGDRFGGEGGIRAMVEHVGDELAHERFCL